MDSSERAEVCYHTLWKRTQDINAKQETNASIRKSILNDPCSTRPQTEPHQQPKAHRQQATKLTLQLKHNLGFQMYTEITNYCYIYKKLAAALVCDFSIEPSTGNSI